MRELTLREMNVVGGGVESNAVDSYLASRSGLSSYDAFLTAGYTPPSDQTIADNLATLNSCLAAATTYAERSECKAAYMYSTYNYNPVVACESLFLATEFCQFGAEVFMNYVIGNDTIKVGTSADVL